MQVLRNLVANDCDSLTNFVFKLLVDIVLHLMDFKHEFIEMGTFFRRGLSQAVV